MFQVQNQATYSQFQVKTRDELLFELDLLGARQKKKGENATFNVFYLDEDGRLQDKRSLTFPLEGIVDEVLADFGQANQKTGFFKRLFSFKKRDKATEAQVEAISTGKGSPAKSAQQEELSVSDLLELTNVVEEETVFETPFYDEVVTKESEMSLEDVSHDLEESNNDDSDSIFGHVGNPASVDDKQEEILGEEEEQSLPETESESEFEEHTPIEIKEGFEGEEQTSFANRQVDAPILKVVASRDIESLTVTRQKQSFELQLQEEVDQIDELIARLTKKKEGHLKLLHHIQQFTID
ncbi:hypothetical protein [Streptococcus cuniculi]|uniref:Uncharacterized protein n=1 Tax=Streptococcus cuniculi TaxID=1432788 RepID=A0A4Y9J8J1_9STRE|nr:hypothetical protein [Streptococcus cuniculi]MBF0778918.1 hypothetical protein [Streptococcus cuniculi]TFU97192.1 hypothetical protein E4T82_09335 [Streptococcus cuniculi]